MGPDFKGRRTKLARRVKENGLDGLLISGQTNVRYLTGFTGDSTWLWVSSKKILLLSDTRYETQLGQECAGVDAEIRDSGSTLYDLAGRIMGAHEARRVGVEADFLTLSQHSELSTRLTNCELVATTGLVEQLREIKDRWELKQIREAIRIAERGFAVIRASLTGDQSEERIRFLLEESMRSFGGAGTAFEPIVGAGPTAALPHAHAGQRKVRDHSVLLVDWGAVTHSGYRSDLTRVLVTGKPGRQVESIYRLVRKAQQAAIDAIAPGVPCADVDRIARGIISDAGYGKYFGHGLGHGIGLDIHESVRMSPISTQVFRPGMVVTVEPGVYLPGRFGIRIEDDVLVTETGREVLTNVPREFEEAVVPYLE